jgi:hypothetical protein
MVISILQNQASEYYGLVMKQWFLDKIGDGSHGASLRVFFPSPNLPLSLFAAERRRMPMCYSLVR